MKSTPQTGGIGADLPAKPEPEIEPAPARSMEHRERPGDGTETASATPVMQHPAWHDTPIAVGANEFAKLVQRLEHTEQRLQQAEIFMQQASTGFQTLSSRIDALRGQLATRQTRTVALDAAIKHASTSGVGTPEGIIEAAKQFAAFLDDDGPQTVEPTIENAAPEIVRH